MRGLIFPSTAVRSAWRGAVRRLPDRDAVLRLGSRRLPETALLCGSSMGCVEIGRPLEPRHWQKVRWVVPWSRLPVPKAFGGCRLTELHPDPAAAGRLPSRRPALLAYLHPHSRRRTLLKPCWTGLAIGSVICEFPLPIAATSDVFIACLANCRNGYPTARS
jgi:hypothetical protein